MLYPQEHLLSLDNTSVHAQEFYRASSFRFFDMQTSIDHMAEAEAKERGAIFTKREIVEFILDLVGYIPEKDLSQTRLLEPSFGSGDFLLSALERLLQSYILHKGNISEIVPALKKSFHGVEVHSETFFLTLGKVLDLLRQYGISEENANELANYWLQCDDFLLTSLPHNFTHIVGNPPYLRQELIPDQLIACYRALYKTIYDRADLYVPFIERSLGSLVSGGKLAFICSDRWIKNKYGKVLRELISKEFHLQTYIDMANVEAFHSEVTAYPAITLLIKQKSAKTYVVHKPIIETSFLKNLAVHLREESVLGDQRIQVLNDVVNGGDPWITDSVDQLTLLRRLEESFPLFEDDGCKVGIGVATGCDSVYIGLAGDLPIEEDRKLPLAMASDIQEGHMIWNKHYIVNPFGEKGELVNLEQYPLLAQYFKLNEAKIKNRNVAKKNVVSWYRTIDKIYVPLTGQPKLLIPDIKGEPTVVYDEGKYYPHHNLYYVISTQWDLQALQAILRSPIAKLFVSAYSVKMRGGYMRFQAQNIRRIRLPRWKDVSPSLRERLIYSIRTQNKNASDEAVFELYQLSNEERLLLQR